MIPIRQLILLRDVYYAIEGWVFYAYDEVSEWLGQKHNKPVNEQPLLDQLDVDSTGEDDNVNVTNDYQIFPAFTVEMVDGEQPLSDSDSDEVQEWMVKLDDDFRDGDDDDNNDHPGASPGKVILSPQVPHANSVTEYSLKSKHVVVSYTFNLDSTQ